MSRLIEAQHLLCRPPSAAEREAVEKGFEVLSVQVVHRWPRANS